MFGQPFFPRTGSDVCAGLADGGSIADGDSLGVGVGDAFLRFDLVFGVGDGVGQAFFRLAEAVGDGVGVGPFVECFRCFGVGLGSGSRTFLIFEPSDSSAECAASMAPSKMTRISSHFITCSYSSKPLLGSEIQNSNL